MKKIYTMVVAISIATMGFTQTSLKPLKVSKTRIETDAKSLAGVKIKGKKSSSSLSATSRWYDYSTVADANSGGLGVLNSSILFPDSTILVKYSDGGTGFVYASPNYHHAGNLFDPKSDLFNTANFNDELLINSTSSYTVDSIDYYFIYNRVNDSIVDSLIFQVAANPNYPGGYFSGTDADYGTDTVFIKDVPYNYTTNTLGNGGTKKRYAFALDSALFADSTDNGIHHIAFACTGLPTINPGKLVFTSVKFKPGYTWTENVDTLSQFNNVRMLAYEEKGDNTFPSYRKRDYNCSYLVTTSERYNISQYWNGSLVPEFAFGASYFMENPLFSYKISSTNGGVVSVGLNENSISNNNVSIYPNPTSNTLNIKMAASNTATAKLININGQVVHTENVANKTNTTIDMNNFAKGIYTLQIVSDKGVETKKVIKN